VFTDPRGRRRLGVAVLAFAGLVLLTVDVVLAGTFRILDGTLSGFVIEQWRAPWRRALPPLTYLGQRGVIILPLIGMTLLSIWRTRSIRPLVVVVGTLLGTALVVGTMKLGFGRTAPGAAADVFGTTQLSYPSGHAVNTIVIWTLVLRMLVGLYGDRLRLLRTGAARAVLVGLISAACGLSMVGLNYHWLSDVLAGWLLGVAIVVLTPSVLPARYTAPDQPAAADATRDRSRQESGRPVPSA
jgi:membrane-associated phospholipid phosphatase